MKATSPFRLIVHAEVMLMGIITRLAAHFSSVTNMQEPIINFSKGAFAHQF